MKPIVLLLVLAAGAGIIGYQEVQHRADRAAWRAENARLMGYLDEAERLADERALALSHAEREGWAVTDATARLAELETRTLDAATELALLESDRAVARDRASQALEDLKEQVRSFTAIEAGIAVLERRRQHLERDVETVEERLAQAEQGAADRQERAETLDRDIAALAIRREVLLAKLDAGERALATAAEEQAVSEAEPGAAPIEAVDAAASPTDVLPKPAAAPVAIIDDRPPSENGERARGLYRFGRLSATPEASAPDDLNADSTPPAGGLVEGANPKPGAADWAEDQYLMGLSLVSNAERGSGTRELSEAVLAFKAVLGEWPKEQNRMRWAIARSDLGYALALLGKRQRNIAVLQEAAEASRDALGEFAREETPILWAAAQHHLGVSLGGLAGIRDDEGLWRRSIEALEEAAVSFKDAGAAADARKVESRLREAYNQLPKPSADKAE